MLSLLLEKNLKSQIASILIRGQSRTAKQIFYELKKQGINAARSGVYKALTELLNKKIIIKYQSDYQINPQWISQVGKDSNQALKKMLDVSLLGSEISDMKEVCDCDNGYIEGFCEVCHEPVCNHCGFKDIRHANCGVHCLNCDCGNQDSICGKCGQPSCPRCGKDIWVHENQFCQDKERRATIGIIEVDHDCWFSNISEKHHEQIILNSFSDKIDQKNATHSGVLKIEVDDKHKTISNLNNQQIMRGAKLIHKSGKTHYIRTRAAINRSVDEFTKQNQSILLNPVIAVDSKEQNLIISPSKKEMRNLSKGLQEFGGKVRIITTEEFNMHDISGMENSRIKEFLDKVPKKELLDNMQRLRLMK